MRVGECLRFINKYAGVSLAEISRRLGRSSEWARNVAQPTRSPSLATVANFADVCGVDVCLVDRKTGETIARIDPETRATD